MSKKITLGFEHWHSTCAEGCCDDYGERIYINGYQIDGDMLANPHDALKQTLKHLGYEVEEIEMEDERIDARSEFNELEN
jgi:hypothetical protein